jgi:V8-like Glu-specific endopeptidase
VTLSFDTDSIAAALLEGKLPNRSEWKLAEALSLIKQDCEGRAVPGIGTVTAESLNAMLGVLLANRLFAVATTAGEFAVARFPNDFSLRRRWAQALIDHGELVKAEKLLDDSLALMTTARSEKFELIGLQGRLAKQKFVVRYRIAQSGGDDFLVEAIQRYAEVYSHNPSQYWHGVNAIALAARAERLGIPCNFDWQSAAKAILKKRTSDFSTDQPDYQGFGLATAAEASWALGKTNDAELWAYRFVHAQGVTAFALGSFARQLRQIWGVKRTLNGSSGGAGGRLLFAVETALVRLSSAIQIDGHGTGEENRSEAQYFEKVFGKERFIGFDRWQKALACCSSIARIEKPNGVGIGTGFVVQGSHLHPSFGNTPVLLTNAHVISDGGIAGSLVPNEARVRFEVDARQDSQYTALTIDKILWSSPPANLGDTTRADKDFDVSICSLKGQKLPSMTLDIVNRTPQPSTQSRAYVVGHPDGDGLQFSLADSELLDVCDDDKLIHYRTPTVGGSSGSPVFNSDWKVFAIHHAGSETASRLRGGGTYMANEGVSIQSIRAAIHRKIGE